MKLQKRTLWISCLFWGIFAASLFSVLEASITEELGRMLARGFSKFGGRFKRDLHRTHAGVPTAFQEKQMEEPPPVLPPMQFLVNRPGPFMLTELENINRTYPHCGRKPHHAKVEEKKIGLDVNMKYGDKNAELFNTGKKASTRRLLIVEGELSVEDAWPWMVGIFKTAKAKKVFVCGSSLITQRYVLTAAHCFDVDLPFVKARQYSIKVGRNEMFDGEKHDIESILFHPMYQIPRFYNDIVVMKTKEPVKLSETVYPICLPSNGMIINLIPKMDVVTAVGWGLDSEKGHPSDILNQITIPVYPKQKCNESYSRLSDSFPFGITDTFICAGHAEGGKDTCKGDSGGPLMGMMPDKSWILLGVLSSGYGCARPEYPGLYTKIAEYMDWIYQMTDLHEFSEGPSL